MLFLWINYFATWLSLFETLFSGARILGIHNKITFHHFFTRKKFIKLFSFSRQSSSWLFCRVCVTIYLALEKESQDEHVRWIWLSVQIPDSGQFKCGKNQFPLSIHRRIIPIQLFVNRWSRFPRKTHGEYKLDLVQKEGNTTIPIHLIESDINVFHYCLFSFSAVQIQWPQL